MTQYITPAVQAQIEKLKQEISDLLRQSIVLSQKLQTCTSPQAKNLYGRKLKKVRAQIDQVSKLWARVKPDAVPLK